jgi:hypothetical protein
MVDNGASHSRSHFLENGLGWGNGNFPIEASEHKTSLVRDRLRGSKGGVYNGIAHQSLPAE